MQPTEATPCACAYTSLLRSQSDCALSPLSTFSFLYPLSVLRIFFYILTRCRLISTISILNMNFQCTVLNSSKLLPLVENAQRMPSWCFIQVWLHHGSRFFLKEQQSPEHWINSVHPQPLHMLRDLHLLQWFPLLCSKLTAVSLLPSIWKRCLLIFGLGLFLTGEKSRVIFWFGFFFLLFLSLFFFLVSPQLEGNYTCCILVLNSAPIT